MFIYAFFLVIGFCVNSLNAGNALPQECDYKSLSEPVRAILCSVEEGTWSISKTAPALLSAGCLLGGKRCSSVMHVPTESEIPPSPPPPDALNKDYQRLATIAEKVVPKVWWREGFDNDLLLLSHNDSELPRKQLNIRQLSNKRMRNMYQCVTRQVFIRVSLDFSNLSNSVAINSKCPSMSDPIVIKFYQLWKEHKDMLGGKITGRVWHPDSSESSNNLLVSALEVLQHFYDNYGGIWTGCFRLEKSPECRGALAAAALVASTHFIAEIAGKQKAFIESAFVRGYMLSSLGRGLLHGDNMNTGNTPITSWGLRTNDFIAMQSAYLRLYIDSFGALYTTQLNQFIPMAFPPTFTVHSKPQWRHLAQSLEPVYTSVRNWMFTEAQALIDFSPYRPLVAFPEVQTYLNASPERRRVLIDVGANGFFASPKYLLDSYAPYAPFTHAIMIEPEPHFSATVPRPYMQRYNITFMPIYAEVATGSETDMLKLLPKLVTKHDFVVLKFDVDPNRFAYGPTMEWGFLFSLMGNPEIAGLVDELYIELHFSFPSLFWKHYHSNWEALDAVRYLRQQGAIVHAWP